MNIEEMVNVQISISKQTGLSEEECVEICKATEKFLKFMVYDAAMIKAYQMAEAEKEKKSDLIIPNDPEARERE